MITREQADRLRSHLLAVLAEDARNTERLLRRLDQISQESGVSAHAALLLILTHLAFEEADAREHWKAVLDHRERLRGELKREVGIRVAVLDYFMNLNRRLTHPTIIDLELEDDTAREQGLDPLTGLASDRTLRSRLQNELRRARRYEHDVSVVCFDLDDFRGVDERLGSLVADRLLREAAMLLHNKVRDIDVAARPGEDELALVLPETGKNGALIVAERFRRELHEYFSRREAQGRPVGLTVSGGVAAYPQDGASGDELLARAAQALYRAKAMGGDRIQVFHPERREYLRFDLEPGRFEVHVLGRTARGQVRNLSRRGILFTSPESLEIGEEIEIRLVTAAGTAESVPSLRGRVVRVEEIPEPEEGEPAGVTHPEDRYAVGVAVEGEGAEGVRDVLKFLEQCQAVLRRQAS